MPGFVMELPTTGCFVCRDFMVYEATLIVDA
jgi:hypothetical protein